MPLSFLSRKSVACLVVAVSLVFSLAGTSFAQDILSFKSIDDVFVRSSHPTSNYSPALYLRVRLSTEGEHVSYIKFDIQGIKGKSVKKATLRLRVIEAGKSGGTVFPVSSKERDGQLSWNELTMTYETAPEIIHGPLSSVGAVQLGETVEFDVTASIEGEGKRSFALRSEANDLVRYSSKEGVQAPELVIELGPPVPLPKITRFEPTSGVVGTEVTVLGENFIGVSEVRLNGIAVNDLEVDSEASLRFSVPEGATAGPINVVSQFGVAESVESFFLVLKPALISFAPSEGPPGTEVLIIGTSLGGVATVLFNGVAAVDFKAVSDTELRAFVPAGATSGPISVENQAGSHQSFQSFSVTTPPTMFTLNPLHDVFVRSAKPTTNYGEHVDLRVRQPHSDQVRSFLKFRVQGTGGNIESVRLRLWVSGGSEDGGELFLVSNNYRGTETSWEETGMLFDNSPEISGESLFAIGAVSDGEVVEIDLTEVIVGDGDYSFAIRNEVNDLVTYSSKEGPVPPELIIKTSFINITVPRITGFQPQSGPVGTQVTITGYNLEEATTVSFGGVATSQFTVQSTALILATVPATASSGKISVTDSEGTGTSPEDFVVVSAPTILSFDPVQGPAGTEVTISGANLLSTTEISFNGFPASSFTVISGSEVQVQVPSGASTGPIVVGNSAGVATSSVDFVVTKLPSKISLTPTDDSFVRSSSPARNYGDTFELRVREASGGKYITYIKFNVAGLGEAIASAKLRLRVIDGSNQGGEVYLSSNNFQGSGRPWNEEELVFTNAPSLTGTPLANIGDVKLDETVEINLDGIVTGDGVYTFALQNSSSDLANYSSKEGVRAPELFIETVGGSDDSNGDPGDDDPQDEEPPPNLNAPVITGFNPVTGNPGIIVTIVGKNFRSATGVSFNNKPTISFIADSDSQIRCTVPFGATSGKVAVKNAHGTGTSATEFVVPGPPVISSFSPLEGPPGIELTILGSNLRGLNSVHLGDQSMSFQVVSNSQVQATVPPLAETGLIRVRNAIGISVSSAEFTVTEPDVSEDPDEEEDPEDPVDPDPSEITVTLMGDVFVDSNRRDRNVGDAHELRVRLASADYNSYLKFDVKGLSKSVRKAALRLSVIDGSTDGGEVYSVSNNFSGSSTPWDEHSLNFENAPTISGSPLSSLGRVDAGQVAEFDVTAAITGNGVYSFALSNGSSDLANYSSKEGAVAPELIIETGDLPSKAPVITTVTPNAGGVGTEVTLFGENFIGSFRPESPLQGEIRIMPLGNSITQGVHGSTDNAGYRNDLAELLQSQRIDFDFVGTKRDGSGFDRHHEGHSGFRADELLAELPGYLRQRPPDMILLHIGTNDISEQQSPASTIDEISDILDTIHDFDRDIIILVSSVIPRRGSKNDETTQLNRLIAKLIPQKQAVGYDLHYAGNNEAFLANPNWERDYLDDNVHPNDRGYAVMGGVWLDTILEVLDGRGTGTGASTLTVAFNGVQSSQVTVDSESQLRATVPVGARSGKVTLNTSFGAAFSPTNFEVLGSSAIALNLPRGGESWEPGSTHTIAWESAADVSLVNVEYSLDGGLQWQPIIKGAPNDGRHIWQTPSSTASNVMVRISDAGNTSRVAQNSDVFTLAARKEYASLMSLQDIKRAALGQIETDGDVLSRGDLNKDGRVDLIDMLSSLDFDLEQMNEGWLAKNSPAEGLAKVWIPEHSLNSQNLNSSLRLESDTPIRGFHVKLGFDANRVAKLVPEVDPKLNMILDYYQSGNRLEVIGYLKKENASVDAQGVLLNLNAHLHGDEGPSEITMLEAMFVAKDLSIIPTALAAEAEEAAAVPNEFELFQNYPNPFNAGTQIKFNVPTKAKVRLQIFNLRGELVRTLLNEEREPGSYKVSWQGENDLGITVASGVYLYRIKAGDFEDSRKLTLVK